MLEEWKDIPDFEGMYQISNYGNLRSLDRYVNSKDNSQRFSKGQNISCFKGNHRYLQAILYNGKIKKTILCHVYVARLFIGEKPEGYEINHKDGNKVNAHVSNLEYVTRSENQIHAIKTGLVPIMIGNNARNVKITEDQAKLIWSLKGIKRNKEVCILLNVNWHTVSDIWYGRRWNHITGLDKQPNRKKKCPKNV